MIEECAEYGLAYSLHLASGNIVTFSGAGRDSDLSSVCHSALKERASVEILLTKGAGFFSVITRQGGAAVFQVRTIECCQIWVRGYFDEGGDIDEKDWLRIQALAEEPKQ